MAVKQWIERRRVGRGYQYWQDGRRITDKENLTYYTSLRIPPAWQDVQVAVNRRSKILAMGTDAAGRRQYIYHPTFRARQEQAKFDRLARFAKALPHMRAATEKHLRHHALDQQKVLACIVRLMDEAYFRVGNDIYARTNKSYGLTTLRSKHTSVEGPTITFDFIGKSGQHQTKRVTNRTLARIIKQLDELPGRNIFKYYDNQGQLKTITSSDVNTYIKELMGEEFSAKDFRTWGGTMLAISELAQCEQAATERDRKKIITQCIKKVARRLGNTPAIARSSYIDPRVITAYLKGDALQQATRRAQNSKTSASPYVKDTEHIALKVLAQAT